MEYKKRLGEKAEDKRIFEEEQKKLKQKYKINEDGIIHVKKKRLSEVLLGACSSMIRMAATMTLLGLSAVGLIALIYTAPRIELGNILQETLEQLYGMLGG